MARGIARLGRPHFAHLRAVVEGVPPEDAARRYLAADALPAARAAHAQLRRSRLDDGGSGQADEAGCQRCGSSSPMRLAGSVGSRSSTSRM
jgi:hypothetical protein